MSISQEALSNTLYDTLLNSQELVFKNNRKKDFDTYRHNELSVKSIGNPQLHVSIKDIVGHCSRYLESKHIDNYDKSRYFIEFHQRNCFGSNKKKTYEWHKDDYEAVHFKTYTFIFYLRKDITVVGGNLLYKERNKVKTHTVISKTMLHFRGDLLHFPEPCSGFGCRDAIVVFMPRLD